MENLANIINSYLNLRTIANNNCREIDSAIQLYKRRRRKHLKRLQFLKQKKILLISAFIIKYSKKCWSLQRTTKFWEEDCRDNGPEFFKENFRMSLECFKELCGLLKNLEKQNSTFRLSIPLEKRVAIALYCLGSSIEFRRVANLFGVGKATVCTCLKAFCNEVWRILSPLYLNVFPLTNDKVEECVQGFESMHFPQCFGVMDSCHIEITPEATNKTDYFNSKGWYSMVLFALVDYRCRFLYISVDYPGRYNDSFIFENSNLKKQLEECSLFQEKSKEMNGVELPIVILGDSAFHFSTKVMKPYPYRENVDISQITFNYRFSKCRKVIENAFGHLKARFRMLGKSISNRTETAALIIRACCVLHNFLNEKNDSVEKKWIRAMKEAERLQQQEGKQQPNETSTLYDSDPSAEEVRRCFTSYFVSDREGASEFDSEDDDVDGGENVDGVDNDDENIQSVCEI